MLKLEPHSYAPRGADPVAAEWGRLTVPESRRGGTSAATIELSFVRLPSTALQPLPPFVFLAGGPGDSGIEAGRGRLFPLFARLCATSDVILLDQRGCGASTPSLRTPRAWKFALDTPLTREAFVASARAESSRAATVLRAGGIDLSAYNTVESAADVVALADALGAEKLNLLGISYGTHLAMAVMRACPERVARAVLAGPEGPNHTYKLPSAVERQLESFGDGFVDTVRAVLRELERAPVRVRATRDGHTVDVTIGRFDVEYITASGSADTRLLALVPEWYANMARGDYGDFERNDLLSRYLLHLREGMGTSAVGFCMDCASGATAGRRQQIEREAVAATLHRTIDAPFPEVCDAWDVPDLGDDYRSPLRTRVPTLFLTGTRDCRTPRENFEELAPGFVRREHYVVENAGHVDLLFGDATAARVARFLATTAPPLATLVYDGDCAFCRRQVERLRRTTGDAVEYRPARRDDEPLTAVQLIAADGSVYSGAEAILRICGGGLLWGYENIPGFAAIAKMIYRLVARNRRRL